VNLQSLYVGPLVTDIAIGFIVLETLLLWLLYTVRGWGLAPAEYVLRYSQAYF